MGGTTISYLNRPANLITLCSSCHRRIESERAWAYGNGLLLPSGGPRPYQRPIRRGDGWVLLDDDGGMTPTTMEDTHDE